MSEGYLFLKNDLSSGHSVLQSLVRKKIRTGNLKIMTLPHQKKKHPYFLLLLMFLLPHPSFSIGFESMCPIGSTKPSDQGYAQFCSDLEESKKAYSRGAVVEPLFYKYIVREGETIFTVAAALSLRQDTIATVNSIEDTSQNLEGSQLVIPSCDGLFVPELPQNQTELLLAGEHSAFIEQSQPDLYTINGRKFYFLAESRFSPSIRAYFLNPGMAMPLEKSVLTSAYGMRVSPVSGIKKFHRGIDLASPRGSSVLACRGGTVRQTNFGDPVYGNYIIIHHPNGMESFYAHLDDVFVKKGDVVTMGARIGTVGMTGLTTGPHLHFEISRGGSTLDPQQYLKKR